MNFEHFESLFAQNTFDEVKVIGRDVELEGHYGHVIGMTLKDRKALVYILELAEHFDAEGKLFQNPEDETHRQQMKESCEEKQEFIFHGVREFHSNGKVYEVAGANSSIVEEHHRTEYLLLYVMMAEHGWKMPKESPLYQSDWNCQQMTVIELREEMEQLPDWEMDLEVVKDSCPKTQLLEIPVVLTCGETPVLSFCFQDGTQEKCYINKIGFLDVWADFECRFQDEEYVNKMLELVGTEAFQKMKQQYEEILLAECPRGKGYLFVEYECSADAALQFYSSVYLDSKPKVHSGSASSMIFMHRPEKEKGIHGLKLRGCVIQTPIEPEKTSLKAELFSYTESVKQSMVKLFRQ